MLHDYYEHSNEYLNCYSSFAGNSNTILYRTHLDVPNSPLLKPPYKRGCHTTNLSSIFILNEKNSSLLRHYLTDISKSKHYSLVDKLRL